MHTDNNMKQEESKFNKSGFGSSLKGNQTWPPRFVTVKFDPDSLVETVPIITKNEPTTT
jgi:hypothetical protein